MEMPQCLDRARSIGLDPVDDHPELAPLVIECAAMSRSASHGPIIVHFSDRPVVIVSDCPRAFINRALGHLSPLGLGSAVDQHDVVTSRVPHIAGAELMGRWILSVGFVLVLNTVSLQTQEGPRRGTIKDVTADTITITIDGTDIQCAVTAS
jgi:hypothetical protein